MKNVLQIKQILVISVQSTKHLLIFSATIDERCEYTSLVMTEADVDVVGFQLGG